MQYFFKASKNTYSLKICKILNIMLVGLEILKYIYNLDISFIMKEVVNSKSSTKRAR